MCANYDFFDKRVIRHICLHWIHSGVCKWTAYSPITAGKAKTNTFLFTNKYEIGQNWMAFQ